MASIDSPTDDGGTPLHPEIHDIVSLATAHTQKVYFSGPVSYSVLGRDVWAQLTGTILSFKEVNTVGQQGKEIPQSDVNVTDVVRPPFRLRYPWDSAKPSSLGRHSQSEPAGDLSLRRHW
jgi:hypothetical protein